MCVCVCVFVYLKYTYSDDINKFDCFIMKDKSTHYKTEWIKPGLYLVIPYLSPILHIYIYIYMYICVSVCVEIN